ncbi:hypothetical protein EXIGLDRAFT_763256 [Exidia glandulosa HHB12029]|uniref:Small ribosomal subunit protein mS29 n=1 Tax=Exidia glandulosa HHB12029 TaxID=1314781 RepID=A0A165M5D7_EXIGL|nr:hypothetical protein EXIGLDRAFT_763256 [Exidia glandulosa HHB12029]
MSVARARVPALARGISSTAPRCKKVGAPDKKDRERIRQEQDKANKDRANSARLARARGDDWVDSGYQPQMGRIILDRKRGRHRFPDPVATPPKPFNGRLPGWDRLKDFGTEHLEIGKPTFFPTGPKDPIPIFGVPRSLENDFRLLGKPASVTRQCTLDIVEFLKSLKEEKPRAEHRIITGSNGSGKSYTLLQAVHRAAQEGWIVVYVPRALDLVKNVSDYIYDRRTRTFFQPQASREILQRIVDGNALLRRTLSGNTYKMAEAGIQESSTAPEALQAVLTNLGQQTTTPVLIAVDEVQALYSTSWYKDPYFKDIEACHLSVPRLLLEFASGRKELQRGAFLGAYTTTNTHFPLPLVLLEAADAELEKPAGPWDPRPEHLKAYISKDLKGFHLHNRGAISDKEAIGMYELWQLAQAVPASNTERTFMNAYMSSSGNPRAFIMDGLLRAMEV